MAPRVRYHDTHENIPVFSGPLYQKGNGIASSLSKVIVPLIRRFSPFLKRNLMKAGKRLASDVLKGESVGTALKRQLSRQAGISSATCKTILSAAVVPTLARRTKARRKTNKRRNTALPLSVTFSDPSEAEGWPGKKKEP